MLLKEGVDPIDRPLNKFALEAAREDSLCPPDNLSQIVGAGQDRAAHQRIMDRLNGKRGNDEAVAPEYHIKASRPAGRALDQAERAQRNRARQSLRLG